jgi:hypothetical protein
MVSDLKLRDLIQKLSFDVYLEKNCSVCKEFKKSKDFGEIQKLNQALKIPRDLYQFKVYKFKRYDATDYIDDLQLCENYLNFCVDFEDGFVPAILITIRYQNTHVDKIKITGEDYDANNEKFIGFLLRRVIQTISNFFN